VEHVCTRCNLPKSDALFHRNGKLGRYTICKLCCKQRRGENAEYYADYMEARQEAIKLVVQSQKSKPCLDCQVEYAPYQMEFDHIKGTKDISIANVWKRNWSIERLHRELEKCELICLGCHRIRTQKRALLAGLKQFEWSLVVNPRTCSKCSNIRDRIDFASRGNCKQCEYERMRSRKNALKNKINSLKDRPCVDCGVKRIPILMDFDHRNPLVKAFEISKAARYGITFEKILVEVAKCDVVCCYCHADRDHRRDPARFTAA